MDASEVNSYLSLYILVLSGCAAAALSVLGVSLLKGAAGQCRADGENCHIARSLEVGRTEELWNR